MTRLALFLLCLPLVAQSQNAYFQQKTDYRIQVALDDRRHTLAGNIEIDYTNNAPVALQEIYLHLWGNAFSSRATAFAKQKREGGSLEFYFAPDSSLGGYEQINFSANGAPVAWQITPENPDIARLELPAPLKPGEKITLATPFLLHIPASFSRLGHVETSYQITQWYPKPAVYDHQGWHAMPYLDQGEFYSEFGDFEVEITLPANYVVGATGQLQTPAEVDFLQKKAEETRLLVPKWAADSSKSRPEHPFPPSSANTKTIRYTATNVHDFAWFADKRFHVLRDTARLASGQTVDCWAMFTDEQRRFWTQGAAYVRRAVEFYSELVGEYPWPQATAVH
ncbi:MAG: M1 family metallopeptidase, partial [Saprospiraceae bacterium]